MGVGGSGSSTGSRVHNGKVSAVKSSISSNGAVATSIVGRFVGMVADWIAVAARLRCANMVNVALVEFCIH